MNKTQKLKRLISQAENFPATAEWNMMRDLCDEVEADYEKMYRRGVLAGLEDVAVKLDKSGRKIEARGVRAMRKEI